MLPYRDSRFTKILLVIFFLIVLGYAYFEARGLLYGPMINVGFTTLQVRDQFITIKGQADRIASLTLDGKAVPVTVSGAFEAPYLLAPGYNRIVLDAVDKYGNTAEKVLEIVYTPNAASTTPVQAASSTPAATSSTPVAPRQ